MGILSGIGGYIGSGKEEKGYKDARYLMQQLQASAGTAVNYIDPFNSYRSGIAKTLNDYVTGQKDISTDPGYQFAYNEGQRGVERAAAARGMNNSGNVMAALQQRGQDVASQQYGAIIDRLTNLAGASSQNAIAAGQSYGNIMTSALTGQADAEIGIGNAQGRGIGSLWTGAQNTIDSVLGAFTGGLYKGNNSGEAYTGASAASGAQSGAMSGVMRFFS